MKRLLVPFFLLSLAGCASAPTETDYCRSFGVEQGNPEYAKCTQHYFQQQAAFDAERSVCNAEADRTYPTTLYSRPYSYPARFYGGHGFGSGIGFSRGGMGLGFGSGGYGGFGSHTEMVHRGADYQQIAEVDRLRMSIIQPCMQKRGWASGADWQAGRMTPGKAAPAKPLPWLAK